MTTIKNREETQRRLMEAVGAIIEERGIEFVGINSVAERAGVSKMLIYRYFGSIDELLGVYIMEHDFWVNVPTALPGRENLNTFIKDIFREQIERLRGDRLMIRLLRWELSSDSPLVLEIRRKREENALQLIQLVSAAYGLPYGQVQFLATLISSAVSYLAMFADKGEVYNGYKVTEDSGWQELQKSIDDIVDQWLPKQKKTRFFL